MSFSPHHCVGFLFLDLYLPARPPRLLLRRLFLHIPTSLSHLFVTHHLSHFHTPSLSHLFVTQHLSHTIFATPSLSHLFVTHHLPHTPSFTHNFVTYHLSQTIFDTPFLTHRTPSFAWQAWHLLTSTVVSRGRRGTWQHPPSFRVAGVALMARLGPLDATALLRGRYGTWRHPPSLCVAGVALGDIDLRLAWLTWHFWDSAGAGRVSHTTLSHTTLSTQLCHTHHLSHTSFSHPTV